MEAALRSLTSQKKKKVGKKSGNVAQVDEEVSEVETPKKRKNEEPQVDSVRRLRPRVEVKSKPAPKARVQTSLSSAEEESDDRMQRCKI